MTTLAVAFISGALAQTPIDCNTDSDCPSDMHCWQKYPDMPGKCSYDDRRRIVGTALATGLAAAGKITGTIAAGALVGATAATVANARSDRDDRYYAPRPQPYYPQRPYFPAPGPSYYPSLDPLSDVGSENWGCQSNDDCPNGANCYLGSNGRSNYCQFGGSQGTLCDDTSDCFGNQICQYGVCMSSSSTPLMGRRLEDAETSAEVGEDCFFHGVEVMDGETVPEGHNCNTCTCHDGTMSCTENPCPEPPQGNEVANKRRIIGPTIATLGLGALGALGGAALVDVARNGATVDDSYEPYYAPRYNQPRPYYPQPYPQPYPSNRVGSNNGGCQGNFECSSGAYCYLGSNGNPNFCGSLTGNGVGSLCIDNSRCPWNTSCQHGVCRSVGRRLENEGELAAPEVTLTAEE